MNRRLVIVGWLMLVAFVILLVGAMYLGFTQTGGEPIRPIDALWAASFAGFPIAGALVVSRLPTRPLGWILLAAPLLLVLGLALAEAARGGPAGWGPWLEWAAGVCFFAGLGQILLVPLFLPNGTLPSRRWRWVAGVLTGCVAMWVLSAALRPGSMEMATRFENPLGVEGLRGFFELAETLLGPVTLTAVALGALSLVVRFRRSSGQEREQLKWLALGGVISIGCFVAIWLLELTMGDLSDTVVTLITMVAIVALPAAIATAVVRHRLYDVDVVIRKTLVYASLSAILGFSYLALVVLLQRLFGPLLQGSDIAVAGIHPCGGRSFPTHARPGAVLHRQALLPAKVRRCGHACRVRGEITEPGRSGGAVRRAASCGGVHGSTGACFTLAQGGRTWRPAVMPAEVRGRRVLMTVLAFVVALELAGIFITLHTSRAHGGVPIYTFFREGLVNGPAMVALAFVMTLRLPRHRVTWAFVTMAAAAGVQQAAGSLAHEIAAAGGSATSVLFISAGAQSAFVMTWLLLLVLFPTGDTISKRWRFLPWTVFVALPLVAASHLFARRPFSDEPLFSDVPGPLADSVSGFLATAVPAAGGVLAFGCVLGGVAQLFLRYRRGTAEVRRQLSLFFYAVVVAILVLLVPWPGSDRLPGWLLWSLAPLGIWTAIAVAIVKHRLYDIDLVVNRTLVYGSLTAVLGSAYLGSVVVLQRVLAPITSDSDIAVAGSTLAVAALFRPARARVQRFIDHRFYRRKYDAAATLGAFSVRLRDQVDLDALGDELVAVVGATMQPAHASLWLRTLAGGATR